MEQPHTEARRNIWWPRYVPSKQRVLSSSESPFWPSHSQGTHLLQLRHETKVLQRTLQTATSWSKTSPSLIATVLLHENDNWLYGWCLGESMSGSCKATKWSLCNLAFCLQSYPKVIADPGRVALWAALLLWQHPIVLCGGLEGGVSQLNHCKAMVLIHDCLLKPLWISLLKGGHALTSAYTTASTTSIINPTSINCKCSCCYCSFHKTEETARQLQPTQRQKHLKASKCTRSTEP